MRRIIPALVLLAIAACSPAPGATPTGSPSPGATAVPTAGATAATSTTAPAGPISDLATRFPVPGTARTAVWNWTSKTRSTNETGKDEVTYTSCTTSCLAKFTRTVDGVVTRSKADATIGMAEGVIVPVQSDFDDEVFDLSEALKKGGGTAETVTVPAGTYATTKYTYGGATTFTFWIQKPWVIKAEMKGATDTATLELQSLN